MRGSIRCLDCRKSQKECRCRRSRREVRVYAGVDPITGKKRQVSRTVRGTKSEAEAELARVLVKIGEGEKPAAKGTVAYLLERWCDETLERLVRGGDFSANTLYGYRSKIRCYIRPAIGDIEVGKLTARDLDSLYAKLERQKKSASTIHACHTVMSGALKQALKWGWVNVNVAQAATPPGIRRADIRPPTKEEVRALLAEAERRNPDLAALLAVAATTGARRGELCPLRWSDVNLDSVPYMTIRRSMVDLPGVLTEKDTKSHRARRLALDGFTVAVLTRHRDRQLEKAGKKRLHRDPFVFSQSLDASTPYRPLRVTAFFRNCRDKLGLRHVTMHGLRHFMATQAIFAGHDIRTVSGRLGHSKTSTTLDIYSHFIESADQAVASHMGELLSG